MDGSPSRGETIPIRLFLGGFDLTPTFRDVNKKFSTRYYLSLVLIDEGKMLAPPKAQLHVNSPCADARRYFKQSEIILYRQAPDAVGGQAQIMASAPENPKLMAQPTQA